MQFNININQKSFVENSKNCDIIDASILTYLIYWCGSDNKGKKQMNWEDNGSTFRYTWINFKHLIKEMPLLPFKGKSSVSKRIDKLVNNGWIKKILAPERSCYIRLTAKIDLLFFENPIEEKKPTVSVEQQGVAVEQQHNDYTSNNINTSEPSSDLSKNQLHKDFQTLASNYMEWFPKVMQTAMPPIFKWGQCEKLGKPLIKQLGLPKMQKLLVKYLKSKDAFYKKNCWSFSCFLSSSIIHQLQYN